MIIFAVLLYCLTQMCVCVREGVCGWQMQGVVWSWHVCTFKLQCQFQGIAVSAAVNETFEIDMI